MKRGMLTVALTAMLCGSISLTSYAEPQATRDPLGMLAKGLADRLVGKKRTRVTVLDFTDIQNRPNELGRYLALQLANELVNLTDIAVLDRANIATIMAEHPKAKIDVAVKTQYRNMKEYLDKEPRAVRLAEKAVRSTGVEPKFASIRGGTDGSRLSEMGLPTPNLSVGMHNFHSKLEFACLEEMESATKVLIELARLWGKEK